MKKKLLTISFLALFIYGCGIDQFIQLEPPEPITSTINTAGFKNIVSSNYNYNQAFSGFEIYYKINSTNEEVSTISTPDALKSAGFKRMCADSDKDEVELPLIKIPVANREGVSTFIIDFSNPGSEIINATPEDASGVTITDMAVYRSVKDADGNFKNFNTLTSGDDDLRGIELIQFNTYFVSLYVFSYGIEDLSQPRVSASVFLSNIPITHNP